ncbi:hypothetical protein DSECCO2_386780 [anaerobic digester metagenome]
MPERRSCFKCGLSRIEKPPADARGFETKHIDRQIGHARRSEHIFLKSNTISSVASSSGLVEDSRIN